MSDKPARAWLARDTKIQAGMYKIYLVVPPKAWHFKNGRWLYSHLFICPERFHEVFPEVELDYGEDPIEVRFQVHEVRNGKLVME